MAEKMYKCMYSHCSHPEDKLKSGEGITIGNRHFHTECMEESNTVKEIRKYYCENISDTVVLSFLNKVINAIVYDKKVSADFLFFALRYAVTHHVRVNSPAGLHYLIDNHKIKDEYAKNRMRQESTKPVVAVSCDDDFDFSVSTPTPVKPERTGFGRIIKG